MKRREDTCCTDSVPGRAGDAFVSIMFSRRLNVESRLLTSNRVCACVLDAKAAIPAVPMIVRAGS